MAFFLTDEIEICAMKRFVNLLVLSIAVWCSACTNIPTPAQRKHDADTLAVQKQWQGSTISAGKFQLMAYLPTNVAPTERLTIYIEGDGLAWITASQPSRDPTPLDPLALRLALAQPEGAAAYLGRPCQYVDAEVSHCSPRYWTDARFAPEVIGATNAAIDVLKQRAGARRLTLVGYSGGGAVAALVAGRRSDVERLITVAGNLNPAAWAAAHGLAPLRDSLNPADNVSALQGIAQWHLVGGKDDNITPELTRSFAALFAERARPTVIVESEFDHRCCWVEQWPVLWRKLNAQAR
jgi:dienelactone hydrolase